MKRQLLKSIALLGASAAAVAFTGCSKDERNDLVDATKDTYQGAKEAITKGFENAKAYTFEKRAELQAALDAHREGIDADVSKMQADYSAANASASRKAAMEELKNADADFKQKLAALGNATADTWIAARDRTVAAWDRLQAAYAKARAEK